LAIAECLDEQYRRVHYLPHEHRLMMRCQVMADRIFDPTFVRVSLQPLAAR
jgi:hypothetical protein